MKLETLILSEVSQKKNEKYHMILHIWNLIYGMNETFHRKKIHGLGEQTCGCQGGGGGSEMSTYQGSLSCLEGAGKSGV